MTFDKDGNVYLLDAGAKAVFVWSAEGAFLAVFGREGEGPGELSLKNGVGAVACTDTIILIYDETAGRLHLWDRKTRHFLRSASPPLGLGRLHGIGFLGGRLVAKSARQDRIAIVAISADLDHFDVLHSIPETRYVQIGKGAIEWRPFANQMVLDYGEDHLYYGETTHNWIRKMDLNGRFEGEWLLPMAPRDLDQGEKAWMNKRFKQWRREGDRIDFPKEYHRMTLITPIQGGRYLMASRFFWNTGTLEGVAIDTRTSQQVGSLTQSFGTEIGYFGIFHEKILLVDTDSQGDYRVGLQAIVLADIDGRAGGKP